MDAALCAGIIVQEKRPCAWAEFVRLGWNLRFDEEKGKKLKAHQLASCCALFLLDRKSLEGFSVQSGDRLELRFGLGKRSLAISLWKAVDHGAKPELATRAGTIGEFGVVEKVEGSTRQFKSNAF